MMERKTEFMYSGKKTSQQRVYFLWKVGHREDMFSKRRKLK